MALFDWIQRGPRAGSAAAPVAWQVSVAGGELLVEDGRGPTLRAPLAGARSVRVVPLMGGDHHAVGGGWQVTLARPDGDVLVGKPLRDWHSARALADLICQRAGLPLDELTQQLFSRVGQGPR